MNMSMRSILLCVLLSAPVFAGQDTRSIRAEVNGLVCAFCAQGIQAALSREPAAKEVFVSLQDRLVAVELEPGLDLSDEQLTQLLEQAGYDVVSIERGDESIAAIRDSLRRGR